MPQPEDVFVIVPTAHYGWAVCAVGDLYDRLEDGESYTDAVDNAAMDSIDPSDAEHRERLRKLNENGDSGAYWKL